MGMASRKEKRAAASGANPRTAFEALKAANLLAPDNSVYRQIMNLHQRRKVSDREVLEYLETEQQRLAGLKKEGREEVLLLGTRHLLAERLSGMYAQLADVEQVLERKAVWEQKFRDTRRLSAEIDRRGEEIARQWQ